MALSSTSTIEDAFAQFNNNGNWYGSQSAAAARLEAIEFLQVNRAQMTEDQGSRLNWEALGPMAVDLRKFLGAGAPRSFGRSRKVGAAFSECNGIQ